jgi:uncharacterized membrane protein
MLFIVLSVLVTMICLDIVWLFINQSFHSKLFESIQKTPLQVKIIPSILVYIWMTCAVTYFGVLSSKTSKEAILNGGYIGLAMYGLYDFTNLATFKNWTYEMTIKDMTWGTILCAISSRVGFYFK